MASFVFDEGSNQLSSGGGTSWTGDTIKTRLVGSVPSQTATVMTGITGIGTDQTIGSKSKNKDTTNHRVQFKGAAVTNAAVASGSTVVGIVVYKFVTTDADSIPLAFIDVSPDVPTNGSDLTYTPDATNGYVYLQE